MQITPFPACPEALPRSRSLPFSWSHGFVLYISVSPLIHHLDTMSLGTQMSFGRALEVHPGVAEWNPGGVWGKDLLGNGIVIAQT